MKPYCAAVILALALWSNTAFCAASATNTTAGDAGKAIGQQGQTWISSDFDGTIGKPLTTGTQPMTTISGNDLEGNPVSFTAEVTTIPDADVVLTLLMQLSPAIAGHPTDGIQQLDVYQDLTFDSVFDSTWTHSSTSPHIAGICLDGFVTCDNNTWNNCQGYRWQANVSGQISALEAPLVGTNALGGCFCINSSCDNAAVASVSSQAQILQTLGQGVISAIHTKKASWQFGVKANTPPSLEYYGTATGNGAQTDPVTGTSSSAQGSGFMANARTWKENPSSFQSQGETAQTNALTDPTSTGSLVQSSYATGSTTTQRACSITRDYTTDYKTLQDIISITKGSWPFLGTGSDPSTFQSYYNLQASGSTAASSFTTSCNVTDSTQIIQVHVSGSSSGTTDVILDGIPVYSSSGGPISFDLTPSLTNGPHTIVVNWAHSSGDSVILSVLAQEFCATIPDNQDTCAVIAADPNCTLQREEQDSVITIRGGVPTGFSPTAVSRQFGKGVCVATMVVTPWQTKRQYSCTETCPGGGCFDYTGAQHTAKIPGEQVPLQTRAGGGTTPDTVSYNGEYFDTTTGTWESSAINIDVTESIHPVVEDCPNKCKVRRTVANVDLDMGVSSDSLRTDSNEEEFLYYECTGVGGMTCPSLAGDTVVIDCTCIDEMPAIAAQFQALEQINNDMICTDGVKK